MRVFSIRVHRPDTPDTSLISLALVVKDGGEFHAERNDFDCQACANLVEREVLPLLGMLGVPV